MKECLSCIVYPFSVFRFQEKLKNFYLDVVLLGQVLACMDNSLTVSTLNRHRKEIESC